jgi:hypothetical protein
LLANRGIAFTEDELPGEETRATFEKCHRLMETGLTFIKAYYGEKTEPNFQRRSLQVV